MTNCWNGVIIEWTNHESWIPALSRWLQPFLQPSGRNRLVAMGQLQLADDDPDWKKIAEQVLTHDVELVAEQLSVDLCAALVRSYHGCRTDDAGIYLRNGIRLNHPPSLANKVRRIVAEESGLAELRPFIEQRLADPSHSERDVGRLYLEIDHRFLLRCCGHYLLYGSEWIQSVLGPPGHQVLRQRGVPTVLTVELLLGMANSHDRVQLAFLLLREWTRVQVNEPSQAVELSFTFTVRERIPPHLVVGHYHPETVRDPLYGYMERPSGANTCRNCKSTNESVGA